MEISSVTERKSIAFDLLLLKELEHLVSLLQLAHAYEDQPGITRVNVPRSSSQQMTDINLVDKHPSFLVLENNSKCSMLYFPIFVKLSFIFLYWPFAWSCILLGLSSPPHHTSSASISVAWVYIQNKLFILWSLSQSPSVWFYEILYNTSFSSEFCPCL